MVTIGVLFTGSTSTLRNNVQQFSYAGIVYNPLKITKNTCHRTYSKKGNVVTLKVMM